MRPHRQPAAAAPAELTVFEVARWRRRGDADDDMVALGRWRAARRAWHREHQISPGVSALGDSSYLIRVQCAVRRHLAGGAAP